MLASLESRHQPPTQDEYANAILTFMRETAGRAHLMQAHTEDTPEAFGRTNAFMNQVTDDIQLVGEMLRESGLAGKVLWRDDHNQKRSGELIGFGFDADPQTPFSWYFKVQNTGFEQAAERISIDQIISLGNAATSRIAA